jgi:hypothetical protein
MQAEQGRLNKESRPGSVALIRFVNEWHNAGGRLPCYKTRRAGKIAELHVLY